MTQPSFATPKIIGVSVRPLRQIEDDRGKVMHMLRADASHFQQFGEIYFSCVNPGKIKGWHLHEKMTLNYALVSGSICLALYDGRKDSSTYGEIDEMMLSETNYCLVTIPPGIWNAFQGLGNTASVVANCATHPYDPNEIVRVQPQVPEIPYRWSNLSLQL